MNLSFNKFPKSDDVAMEIVTCCEFSAIVIDILYQLRCAVKVSSKQTIKLTYPPTHLYESCLNSNSLLPKGLIDMSRAIRPPNMPCSIC